MSTVDAEDHPGTTTENVKWGSPPQVVVWFPIDERKPPEDTELLLTGPSGYARFRKFMTKGWYCEAYRPSRGGPIRWLDEASDALSDRGWYPTHWARPIALP